jgi:hypothetical protein
MHKNFALSHERLCRSGLLLAGKESALIFHTLIAVAVGALLFTAGLHAQTISSTPSAAKTDQEGAASDSTEQRLTAALIQYVKHDYVRALQMLTPLAEEGHAKAQATLGTMYSSGEGGDTQHGRRSQMAGPRS